MSDKKTITVKTILSDKVVTIEIGTGFYNRVQKLLLHHINSVEPETSISALNQLPTREPKDAFEEHLLTLLTLTYNIEAAFDAAGHVTPTEVPLPENKG